VEYFKHLSLVITNKAIWKGEIKSRIGMAKEAFKE
jgi:hypothetical protein